MSYASQRKSRHAQIEALEKKSSEALAKTKVVIPSSLVAAPSSFLQPKSVVRTINSKSSKRKIILTDDATCIVDVDSVHEPNGKRFAVAESSSVSDTTSFPALWLDPEFLRKRPLGLSDLRDLADSIADVRSVKNLNLPSPSRYELAIGHGLARRVLQSDVINAPISPGASTKPFLDDAFGVAGHAMSQICTFLGRARDVSEITEARIKDVERQHKETCEKLTLAEIARDKAESARDEEEKKGACLDAKLKDSISKLALAEGKLSNAESKLEFLHLSREKELSSHLSMGCDDGCFHILRCMRAFRNIHPDQKELEEWLLMDQDDPLLRVYHSDLPYSDRLMEDFRATHARKGLTMWDPPVVNEENLQVAMERLDMTVDHRDLEVSVKVSMSGGVAAIVDDNTYQDDVIVESCADASLSS